MTQTGPSFRSSQCAETVRRPGGMGSIRPPTGFSLRGSLMYLRKPVYSIVEHIAPGFCQSPPGWRGDILYMLRLTPHRRLGTGRETRATRHKAHRRAPHPPYTLLISLSVCYNSEQFPNNRADTPNPSHCIYNWGEGNRATGGPSPSLDSL